MNGLNPDLNKKIAEIKSILELDFHLFQRLPEGDIMLYFLSLSGSKEERSFRGRSVVEAIETAYEYAKAEEAAKFPTEKAEEKSEEEKSKETEESQETSV